MKTALIIGNGFDVDLGYKTTFKDFIKSSFWPKESKVYVPLQEFLQDNLESEFWFDLEGALSEYAKYSDFKKNSKEWINDKNYFFKIVEGLKKFITHAITCSNIKRLGFADNFMKSISECSSMPLDYICSFNYTNWGKIASSYRINLSRREVKYVHGSIDQDNIVLGITDEENINLAYSFMLKGDKDVCRPMELQSILNMSDRVIFYGLSLSMVDMIYKIRTISVH